MTHSEMKNKEIEKVAVVKCFSYEQAKVDRAVEKALKLIKFNPKNRTKVLIKPNVVMLGADKKKNEATITHPSIVEALCKFFKKNECTIYIGESSFMNTDCFMKRAGMDKIAKKYAKSKKATIFEQEKLVRIKNKNAKILKEFEVPKVLKEVDYIVNVPKMKTHLLTLYTGGIKNLYGIIAGGMKQRLHNTAKGEKNFSDLLVDIYESVKPNLTLMDCVIGMEGHGPASGNPKKAGLILASKNTIALDIAACRIMKIKPKKVLHIKYAIKRGLYPNYDFELTGLEELPVIKFRKPILHRHLAKIKKLFKEKPIVCDESKCTKCRTCEKHCPVKAITLKPFPVIDKKKCIRCFCCMEICPRHALSLGK